jgi:hypothetical protein
MNSRRIALAILLSLASLTQAQSNIGTLKLTFTTIDVPGAGVTNVSGINAAGEMVGWYSQAVNTPSSGFLLSGGNFTFLNYPAGYDTVVRSINDSGVIAGYSGTNHDATYVGFTYSGGTFTTISFAGYLDSYAEGINNAGDVVGGFGNFGANNGYERAGTKFKNVTPPGSWNAAYVNGINNLGQMVGDTTSSSTSGFYYSKGKFETLTFPGSSGVTAPEGINDAGIVVGSYSSCTPGCGYHGFVLTKGKYFSVDFPGAAETFALGISSLGQIVGNYCLGPNLPVHGFVTNPVSSDLATSDR